MTATSKVDPRAAKLLADRLEEYRSREEAQHFPELAQRAQQLELALRQRLDLVEHPAPRIAFVAHKGVGKSTLINALAGLWLDETPPPADASSKQLNQRAMLPLGNGGTTPCEIRVEAGTWEVRVEAEDLQETQARIRQFAEWAWHKVHDPSKQSLEPGTSAGEVDPDREDVSAGGRPPRLQPDLERVVRGITNLQDLPIASPPGSGAGKKRQPSPRHDGAEDLAKGFPAKTDFVAEVERRARLPERKRLQWLPTGDARRWLRDTLLNLIEGKFEDQPFPKSVTIRVPSTGIQWRGSDVPLIDTLGLPAVASGKADGDTSARSVHPLAEREDLRELLKSPWTIIVVGAQFNEPPAPSVELLQQMMDEGIFFGETLEDRTVVAIVDAGKAGAGNFEDAETERSQKEDRCAENMVRLGCPRGAEHANRWTVESARERVVCVNVLDGGCDPFQQLLHEAVERMVAVHEARLGLEIAEAESFFYNLGDARRQAIRQDVVAAFKRHLSPVAQKQLGKARSFRSNLLGPFAGECRAIHPSTLRSVIVNRGRGSTQSAWAMLESSTTRVLTRLLEPFKDQIHNTSEALLAERRYQDDDGRAMIAEEADRRTRIVEAFLKSFIEELVSTGKEHLLADAGIWRDCAGEWGRAIKDPGYKMRVAGHFDQWGVDNSPDVLAALVDPVEQASVDDTGFLSSLTE